MPVSDPNIISSTQRISLAQAQLELASQQPQLYKMYDIHYNLLKAMGIREPDEILLDPNKMAKRLDPVSEGGLVLAGRPIRAFIEQNHDAHLFVHKMQLQDFQQMAQHGNQSAQMAGQLLLEHIAKHEAYGYMVMMQQQLGQELPPVDLYSDDDSSAAGEMPIEVERMVSQSVANQLQRITQQKQQAAQAQQAAQQEQLAAQEAEQKQAKLKDQAEMDVERKRLRQEAEIDAEAKKLVDESKNQDVSVSEAAELIKGMMDGLGQQ
jgi:hypothetical protein